jgi:hypothetical protein
MSLIGVELPGVLFSSDPAPPFEPSVKNIDEESNPDVSDAINQGITIW